MGVRSKWQDLPKGVTRRKDGRYVARFAYKGDRYVCYGSTVKEVEKQMRDKRYEVEHGMYARESKITLDTWFDIWIEQYKANSVKYGTLESYKSSYRCYIQKPLGRRKLVDIRPEHIQKIFNEMSEKYTHKTIKLVKTILGGMYKQAVKNEMIKRDPVSLTTLPRNVKKKEFRVLDIREQKLLIEELANSIYGDFYEVLLGTGERGGELRALELSDLDFKNRVIHVTGTLKWRKGKGYYKDLPKTRSSERDIPMLDTVYALLKKRKKKRAEQKLVAGNKWNPTSELENLLFCNEVGEPISHSALNQELKKIEEKIRAKGHEFEHITPHTLRHTFATRGLEAGIPPKVMQELLGHTSITMTLDIYSHVLPDTKAKEIQKIANLI